MKYLFRKRRSQIENQNREENGNTNKSVESDKLDLTQEPEYKQLIVLDLSTKGNTVLEHIVKQTTAAIEYQKKYPNKKIPFELYTSFKKEKNFDHKYLPIKDILFYDQEAKKILAERKGIDLRIPEHQRLYEHRLLRTLQHKTIHQLEDIVSQTENIVYKKDYTKISPELLYIRLSENTSDLIFHFPDIRFVDRNARKLLETFYKAKIDLINRR